MNVSLRNLVKSFGTNRIVDDVSATVESGRMFFLLGPSGCGKTTILRMVAGFYPPDQGEILFGEKKMNTVPPEQRNTALVFQNYAIWPHMTVFENVAYGLRVRRVSGAELNKRVDEALELVRMSPYRDRKPTQLSGGQQQRVALGRALVVKPDVLLFDEPLSNLDAKLRLEMRDEIRQLRQTAKLTSIYVTHDQEEALSLADSIAVMHAGKLQQVGTPREIYDQPANAFVAGFIGEINLFEPGSPLASVLGADPAKRFGFRPERVLLNGEGKEARVLNAVYLGSKVMLDLEASGVPFKAWSPAWAEPGTTVRFTLPDGQLHSFSA